MEVAIDARIPTYSGGLGVLTLQEIRTMPDTIQLVAAREDPCHTQPRLRTCRSLLNWVWLTFEEASGSSWQPDCTLPRAVHLDKLTTSPAAINSQALATQALDSTMIFDKRLIFPAILFICNIASAIVCFAGGDWRRGLYWTASSVCIASVSAK